MIEPQLNGFFIGQFRLMGTSKRHKHTPNPSIQYTKASDKVYGYFDLRKKGAWGMDDARLRFSITRTNAEIAPKSHRHDINNIKRGQESIRKKLNEKT